LFGFGENDEGKNYSAFLIGGRKGGRFQKPT